MVIGKEMKVNGLIAELYPSMSIFSLLPFSINWQTVSLSRLLNFVSEKLHLTSREVFVLLNCYDNPVY